jgi:hypothetical protein
MVTQATVVLSWIRMKGKDKAEAVDKQRMRILLISPWYCSMVLLTVST